MRNLTQIIEELEDRKFQFPNSLNRTTIQELADVVKDLAVHVKDHENKLKGLKHGEIY